VPALPPYIVEPIFEQFAALLPERNVGSPSWLPSLPHPREGDLREASSNTSVRLCLLEDSR
jgi:hypothetical protein